MPEYRFKNEKIPAESRMSQFTEMKARLLDLQEKLRPTMCIVVERAIWQNSHLITPKGKIADMRE